MIDLDALAESVKTIVDDHAIVPQLMTRIEPPADQVGAHGLRCIARLRDPNDATEIDIATEPMAQAAAAQIDAKLIDALTPEPPDLSVDFSLAHSLPGDRILVGHNRLMEWMRTTRAPVFTGRGSTLNLATQYLDEDDVRIVRHNHLGDDAMHSFHREDFEFWVDLRIEFEPEWFDGADPTNVLALSAQFMTIPRVAHD